METIKITRYQSPVGEMLVGSYGDKLCICDWAVVWEELMKIPYGTTISYGELARRIHNPKAVRAVASANATNPISIFVPCHRVIGSNHKLTGYGGGLDAKKGLLELECSKTMGLGLW